MLVLTRKVGQSIILEVDGKECEVVFCSIMGKQVRLGFKADLKWNIKRKELPKNKNKVCNV